MTTDAEGFRYTDGGDSRCSQSSGEAERVAGMSPNRD